jgi:uncharacterized OB-fold protein
MSLPLTFCRTCGTAQYPTRDACRRCLSDDLEVRQQPVTGMVVSEGTIHRSLKPALLAGGPLRIGAVASPLGIRVIALLASGAHAGSQVELSPCPERPGAIVAHPLQQVQDR